MACSAVVTALPVGVFITTMPRLEAAGDVDVVDADPGAADDLQPVALLDDPGGDPGSGPDDERVGAADGGGEVGLVQAGAGSRP